MAAHQQRRCHRLPQAFELGIGPPCLTSRRHHRRQHKQVHRPAHKTSVIGTTETNLFHLFPSTSSSLPISTAARVGQFEDDEAVSLSAVQASQKDTTSAAAADTLSDDSDSLTQAPDSQSCTMALPSWMAVQEGTHENPAATAPRPPELRGPLLVPANFFTDENARKGSSMMSGLSGTAASCASGGGGGGAGIRQLALATFEATHQ